MTKTDNFATIRATSFPGSLFFPLAYTIRRNFWILRQNQSDLTTNVCKHNSKGIFPLRQFEKILRREVKLFTGEAPKLQFKRTFTNPAAVTRTCFRHNLPRASLARFSKTCQIYVYDVVVGSKFLVSGKNELEFSLAVYTFPEKRSSLSLPRPSPLLQSIFNCFQNGGLARFSTSVRKKRLLCRLAFRVLSKLPACIHNSIYRRTLIMNQF